MSAPHQVQQCAPHHLQDQEGHLLVAGQRGLAQRLQARKDLPLPVLQHQPCLLPGQEDGEVPLCHGPDALVDNGLAA